MNQVLTINFIIMGNTNKPNFYNDHKKGIWGTILALLALLLNWPKHGN